MSLAFLVSVTGCDSMHPGAAAVVGDTTIQESELEGEWDAAACEVVCPRHGSRFDLRTGTPLSLPAYVPVETYPVRVRDDGMIVIDVGD